MHTREERSIACLKGLATGDAIGKQTEGLARAHIAQWYPDGVRGFHGQPGTVIPRYGGTRYEWKVGETTDDTEQAIAVALALLQTGGSASHVAVGEALMACRKSNRPTLALGRFQQRGDPSSTCREGDGCGAAMRVAPVGMIYSSQDVPALVEAAIQTSIPTHGGQLALAAAAAVAAAVSAAIEGQTPDEILTLTVAAAQRAERYRPSPSQEHMAAAIERLVEPLVQAHGDLPRRLRQPDCFPDRTAVIVPLAVSLALVARSAEETALLAANSGGDTDSVAAIGSAIAGALRPDSVNEVWYQVVQGVNQHDLTTLACRLIALRP